MVLPKGIVSTGFPSAQSTCRKIGIEFAPWQVDLNRCILAKNAEGLFAADTVAISIPRQVGKTFDIGALVFADCIANPGTTVVWTAHRFKVSRETFTELRALAKSPKLTAHIDYDDITTGAGNECIPFKNGSRILFAARERGAIRGFTKVRRLILDEAQILTHAAMADLAPTMNQAVNPQIILMGTPPKPSDPSEAFTQFRADALAGESENLLYVEISADPGSDPDDRRAWAKGNPSFPMWTPSRAILRMRKLLSVDDFMREALGIWDADTVGIIPADVWGSGREAQIVSRPFFGLDVAPDRSWACIVAAGLCADAQYLVEVTSRDGVVDHRPGTEWVVPRLTQLRARFPGLSVMTAASSGAGSLVPALDAAQVDVVELPRSDVAAACGSFYDLALAGKVTHLGQESLTNALISAKKLSDQGESAWIWGRKRSRSDITPLYAATLALWAAYGAQTAAYEVADSIL